MHVEHFLMYFFTWLLLSFRQMNRYITVLELSYLKGFLHYKDNRNNAAGNKSPWH